MTAVEEAFAVLTKEEQEFVKKNGLDPVIFKLIRSVVPQRVAESIIGKSEMSDLIERTPTEEFDISHELESLNLDRMDAPMAIVEIEGEEVQYAAYAFAVPATDSTEFVADLIKKHARRGLPVLLYQYTKTMFGSIETIRKVRLGLPT